MSMTSGHRLVHRPLKGKRGAWASLWAGVARLSCASFLILGSSLTQAPASTTSLSQSAPPMNATQALLHQRLQAARNLPPDRRAQERRDIARLLLGLSSPIAVAAGPTPRAPTLAPPIMRPAIDELLDLIAEAEAGPDGYDAVQIRAVIPPPKPPSQMTLAQIQDWIAATPQQQHAIGRYQIIPDTLAYLVAVMGLSTDAVFDPALQDRMALRLLEDVGLDTFLQGEIDPHSFMDDVALIWAGLPLRSGLSAYHGYNGNRATISRETYETRFARIFQ